MTALESAGISIPIITEGFRAYLPLYSLQLGWVIPFAILIVISIISQQFFDKEAKHPRY